MAMVSGSIGSSCKPKKISMVTISSWGIRAVNIAADKAQNQDVKGGQATIKGSYMLRMLGMVVILFAFAKSGRCNVIALVVPLLFTRFTLTLQEFFKRKPGEKTE